MPSPRQIRLQAYAGDPRNAARHRPSISHPSTSTSRYISSVYIVCRNSQRSDGRDLLRICEPMRARRPGRCWPQPHGPARAAQDSWVMRVSAEVGIAPSSHSNHSQGNDWAGSETQSLLRVHLCSGLQLTQVVRRSLAVQLFCVARSRLCRGVGGGGLCQPRAVLAGEHDRLPTTFRAWVLSHADAPLRCSGRSCSPRPRPWITTSLWSSNLRPGCAARGCGSVRPRDPTTHPTSVPPRM